MRTSASVTKEGKTLCAGCLEWFPEDWFPIIKKGDPPRRAKQCSKKGNNCYTLRKTLNKKARKAQYSKRESLIAQSHREGRRQRSNVVTARKAIEG